MKKLILLSLVFLLIGINGYCKDTYKDPFRYLLPEEKTGNATMAVKQRQSSDESKKDLPDITVQGVLWGSEVPQAVIDGEVYKVGDRILSIDARIFKIEENVVFISYGEGIFKLKVKKEGAGKNRAR